MTTAADDDEDGKDRRRLPLDNDQYTYVAARAFLDEEHGRPASVLPNDDTAYTLGRVGRHNVVVAALPDGEYGQSSASRTAARLAMSFPNVRVGLMVGVAGGGPLLGSGSGSSATPLRDIRLGDVVVGTNQNGVPGVLRYDYGKTVQNREFRHTAILDQAPELLRGALASLRSDHELEGHDLDEKVRRVLSSRPPRMRRAFARPPPHTDRLHVSDRVHVEEGGDGGQRCCGGGDDDADDDDDGLVPRPPRVRSAGDDDPAIHYGTIASGDQLVRDASLRDALARRHGVLCFEMESGGVVNHLPCLVVRGICDYCDTHKDKTWQGYAAMVAAAYAVELLARVAPARVAEQPRIPREMGRMMGEVRGELRSIRDNLRGMDDGPLLEWLAPGADHGERHDAILRERRAGTGRWFIELSAYKTWLASRGGGLFCPGSPGVGKTFVACTVIEDLYERFQPDQKVAMAFLYCDYRQERPTAGDNALARTLGAVLRQLIQQRRSMPAYVAEAYSTQRERGTTLPVDKIQRLVAKLAGEFDKVFVVVDALDEYHRFTDLAQQLFALRQTGNINILVTSRPYGPIVDKFAAFTTANIEPDKEDLLIYLDGRLDEVRLLKMRPDIATTIRDRVLELSSGIFLLAKLLLDALVDKTTVAYLKRFLNSFGTTSNPESMLHRAYDQAMNRIKGQGPDRSFLACRILACVIHAVRPLTVSELQIALAVRDKDRTLDPDNLPDSEDFTSLCVGLIRVDSPPTASSNYHHPANDQRSVHLIHFTAYQYLTATEATWFADGNRELACACLTYLSFVDFGTAVCRSRRDFESRLAAHPFYSYAALHWGNHTRAVSVDRVCSFLQKGGGRNAEAALQALDVLSLSPVWAWVWDDKIEDALSTAGDDVAVLEGGDIATVDGASSRMTTSTRTSNATTSTSATTATTTTSTTPPTLASAIHLAAHFRLSTALSRLVISPSSPTITTCLCATCASETIDAPDGQGRSPLARAVERDDTAAMEFLLERGANPNVILRGPSSWSDGSGSGNSGRKRNGGGGVGAAPSVSCSAVLFSSSLSSLQLRSDHRVGGRSGSWSGSGGDDNDDNVVEEVGETPLERACRTRDMRMLCILAGHGADCERRDAAGGRTLLLRHWDDVDVAGSLLSHGGARVGARDREGKGVLAYLCRKLAEMAGHRLDGHEGNSGGGGSQADYRKYAVLINLYADAGLDLNQGLVITKTATNGDRDDGHDSDEGREVVTAVLALAGIRGVERILHVLLSRSASIEARDPETGETALHKAAVAGHLDAVETLLRWGADTEAVDVLNRTPLQRVLRDNLIAPGKKHLSWFPVQLHDATGAPVLWNGENHCRCTAVVLVLLGYGADVRSCASDGDSALSLAQRNVRERVGEVIMWAQGVIVVAEAHTVAETTTDLEGLAPSVKDVGEGSMSDEEDSGGIEKRKTA